jgi:Uma2 family endonuclease
MKIWCGGRSRLREMKAATLVPVEEYLRTTYRPDRDYVEGEVLERNLGEKDHGKLQGRLYYYLQTRAHEWNINVYLEQRVKISSRRFRIPDLCVIAGPEPADQIFHEPPFICIEILSREDRQARIQDRIDDYLNFGVRYVWVINPQSGRAWAYTTDGISEVRDGILRTENPAIEVPLAKVIAGLEE